MNRSNRRVIAILLPALLALLFAGCSPEKPAGPANEEGGLKEQTAAEHPAPEDPEYYGSILIPDYWGEGIVQEEGSPELGYLLVGFNVPEGTVLYAPFDGVTGPASLDDYHSEETCAGRSLYPADSLNGFAAYNVTGIAKKKVKAGEAFAEVSSEQHIFPQHHGKVNLILEFNFFNVDEPGYEEMRDLFEEIFDNLLQ